MFFLKVCYKRDIIVAFIIILVGSLLGIGYNLIYSGGVKVFARYSHKEEILKKNEIDFINIHEIRIFFEESLAQFIDSRDEEEFKKGHLPGAINLPLHKFDEYFSRFAGKIEQDRFLIIYCDKGCDSKIFVADKLLTKGIRNKIFLMEDGWEELQPIESIFFSNE
ncbi:MAG: rhodanese-like domain-containing protein [Thermodesulfobacteriota bacterium]|nr:rhodanese-like domain-containing protein [Thermodesulfobacteriota bacterium]